MCPWADALAAALASLALASALATAALAAASLRSCSFSLEPLESLDPLEPFRLEPSDSFEPLEPFRSSSCEALEVLEPLFPSWMAPTSVGFTAPKLVSSRIRFRSSSACMAACSMAASSHINSCILASCAAAHGMQQSQVRKSLDRVPSMLKRMRMFPRSHAPMQGKKAMHTCGISPPSWKATKPMPRQVSASRQQGQNKHQSNGARPSLSSIPCPNSVLQCPKFSSAMKLDTVSGPGFLETTK
mmetsp:Transcript_89760/g.192436  ORF Transcript_89760/g.192436 Transcript_89760/m.192436 type:complete len:244 (-) Transcript_89760:608-1339(-)